MRSRRRRPARSRERGFTLVELLIALALTAALLVVLFTGIGVGFKGMTRLDEQVARIEARRNLDFVLRRQIAAVYPGSQGAGAGPTFVGQPLALSFLSLDGGSGPAFDRVWLMLDAAPAGDAARGRTLVLMRRPQMPDVYLGFQRSVLARDVTRFHLSYYGRQTPDAPPAWHDRWEGRRVPPELIRVSLALASDGDYVWPDTLVRIWTAEAPR